MTENTKPATILIVEDEQSLADLYADFLASTYTVHTVYNGTEALDTISDEVDVVLLDRRMPGLSGEEVLESIREAGYDCRVAMVTAVTPDVDIIEMGFDDYLEKPVGLDDLHNTVERLVELSTYDDLQQEYYQLVSKKATLEVKKTDIDLSENDEFNRLTDRLDEIEKELQTSEEILAETDIRSLIEGAGTHSYDR